MREINKSVKSLLPHKPQEKCNQLTPKSACLPAEIEHHMIVSAKSDCRPSPKEGKLKNYLLETKNKGLRIEKFNFENVMTTRS